MIRQAISCDICGAEKKQTNHWFVAYEQAGELRVGGWNSRNRLRTGSKHLCGQACLHKLADEFMERTIARKAHAAPVEELEPELIEETDTSLTAVIGTTVLTGSATAGTSIGGTDGTAATTAIGEIDKAINAVNSQRSTYGATENRFNDVISNLQTAGVNQSAAYSRIMDTDYAAETANLSRAQILQQAGNAMVAQANQMPQQILALLK